MKSSSGLPVVNSELPDKQEPQTSIVPVDSISIPPVDQSELDTTTAASSLLVDKSELLTEPTPTEPIIASSSLVEISEPQKVEHDTSDVQVDQKSESSSQVDGSRPIETTTISSPQVDDSESLEAMRGSATNIATTEVIESDNSLLEQTSAISPLVAQSELLTANIPSELKPDVNPPVEQSESISDTTPPEPSSASDTLVSKRRSKPRSQSISKPPRRKTRRRAK